METWFYLRLVADDPADTAQRLVDVLAWGVSTPLGHCESQVHVAVAAVGGGGGGGGGGASVVEVLVMVTFAVAAKSVA